MSKDEFTPAQYFEVLRLFNGAKSLMLPTSKKRIAWIKQAALIKIPKPVDCPICKRTECFVFSPFDLDTGYCAVEDEAHSAR